MSTVNQSVIMFIVMASNRRHDTQHNDIQHNDIQHNDTMHKGIICDIQHNDIQHNDTQQKKCAAIMLSIIILLC